jgi:ribosomal protein L40E
MPLIRCTSCAYANATDAKVCKKCGVELRVPPHLMRCPHCGALNPLASTACVWCFRTLPGSWRGKLRGGPALGVAAAAGVAMLAVIGYYAYPRGLPGSAARPLTAAPAARGPEAPPAEPPRSAADAPRVERQAGDAPRAKSAPATVARQASSTAKAGEPGERCAEGTSALGLCGKAAERQAPRPQPCTEAVAALGLCDSRNP